MDIYSSIFDYIGEQMATDKKKSLDTHHKHTHTHARTHETEIKGDDDQCGKFVYLAN